MELGGLCAFAFLAGFVDSIVGGGGLIQVPALLLLLPPSQASHAAVVLGTNKISSIFGTGLAVRQYAARVPINWRTLAPAALSAFAFSFAGAHTLTSIPKDVLRPIILFLLVAVTIYTATRKDFGERHAPRHDPVRERNWGILVGVVIGFYDGFFGPGTGSFLMFIFIGWFGFDFLAASASSKVINFATNLSAVGYFAATGNILYHYGLPMAACNMLGSFAGTRLAILKGNRFVRTFFLVVVGAMVLRFGWEVLAPMMRPVTR